MRNSHHLGPGLKAKAWLPPGIAEWRIEFSEAESIMQIGKLNMSFTASLASLASIST